MELRIRIGSAVMRVPKPCGRCTMVTRAQPGIDADQKIFTSLAHEHGATFGVLCDVGSAGIIHLDDEVELLGRGPRRYWDSATLRQQPWVQGLRIESLTTFGRSAYDLSRARSAARMPAPPRIVAAVITAQFHVCEAEDLRGAGVHLPGPGIAAARHGIELEGPPFLRPRRPSERNCGSRCCRAPPRRRRRDASTHTKRPTRNLRIEPYCARRRRASRARALRLRRALAWRVQRARRHRFAEL